MMSTQGARQIAEPAIFLDSNTIAIETEISVSRVSSFDAADVASMLEQIYKEQCKQQL